VVQILGIMAGAPPVPVDFTDCGFVIILLDPQLFCGRDQLDDSVERLRHAVHNATADQGNAATRLPGERSARQLREAQDLGVEVPEDLVLALRALAGRPTR
jgi:LDH2 family malate/lactate/ureidoglycolate dehydrogenase